MVGFATMRTARSGVRALVVVVGVAGTLALACTVTRAAPPAPPVAPVRPVTDMYFGTPVVDNYRYMERLDDPFVQSWMKAQAQYTREVLDAIPGRAALAQRIHTLLNADTVRVGFIQRGQRYFYQTYEPGAQVPKLYYRDGVRGVEHVLLDPGTLGAGSSTHYALDYYEPSWDGQWVAYGVSSGGSEASVLHVMNVQTGQVLSEAIERTSDSVISWRPDNRSFFYLRYNAATPDTPPSQTMYDARTYLHTLSRNASGDGDPVVFGRGVRADLNVPEGQGTYVVTAPGSRFAIAVANHNMDDNPATLYVAPLSSVTGPHTPWRLLAQVPDGIGKFFLHGDTLYVLSHRDAPRFRLLSVSLTDPDLRHAHVVIPQSAAVLTDVVPAQDALYARLREGPVSRIERVSLDGRQSHPVRLPFEGNVSVPVTDARESGALLSVAGWLKSRTIVAYDPRTDTTADTGLMPPSSVDTSALESREVYAVGDDGTRIPVSILSKRGLRLDGSHPTMLVGYGSYGMSLEPWFDATRLAWIEHDGVVAVAHLRGGGEFGEDWHLAGQLLTKRNTILDFIACAQYLIDAHYTSAQRLAINGGSAGGIPVGGAMDLRPDLFAAVLDEVGMSDTLRTETEPNGPPNVPEFGSVSSEAGFHGLYAMSSYAHVRDGTAYPAVIFATGANDPRVAPWHMLKMAARVQAATTSRRPVLLRIDYDAGHGIGSTVSQYEAERADLWAFALWQMGEPGFQPAAGP